MKSKKNNQLAELADLKKDLVDDATKRKIRKHLRDKNDKITEEDIRNVKGVSKESELIRKELKKKKDDKEADNKDSSDTSLTPWKILEK